MDLKVSDGWHEQKLATAAQVTAGRVGGDNTIQLLDVNV